jgi:PPP family 3-phenylpropionic acid transporter
MRNRRRGLLQFIVLYTVLFAAFGFSSPFLPEFLSQRGFGPEELGTLLGVGTALRTISGPIAAYLADRFHAFRAGLAIAALLAGIGMFLYVPATGPWAIAVVSLFDAVMLAPLVPLADAMTLACARPDGTSRGFEYGWVRGVGSAAFIAGVLGAGQIAAAHGLSAVILSSAICLSAASLFAFWVPERPRQDAANQAQLTPPDWRRLFRQSSFVWLTLAAALVLGSHAMNDSFAVIRWSAAGISSETSSVLWSESVAAEVVVFLVLGPIILRALGPTMALTIATFAGIARWIVMAQTTDITALSLIQPLHGLTFALFYLACMRIISATVPAALAGTAQAVYGLVGIGGATAILTILSGWLYGEFGAQGFWAMATLCVLAFPVIWLLHASLRGDLRPALAGDSALDATARLRMKAE